MRVYNLRTSGRCPQLEEIDIRQGDRRSDRHLRVLTGFAFSPRSTRSNYPKRYSRGPNSKSYLGKKPINTHRATSHVKYTRTIKHVHETLGLIVDRKANWSTPIHFPPMVEKLSIQSRAIYLIEGKVTRRLTSTASESQKCWRLTIGMRGE